MKTESSINKRNIIDRRQFVIMETPYICEGFQSLQLPCGMVLSYHVDLPIHVFEEGIVLGVVFSSEENNDLKGFFENMQRYAGRWIAITKDCLYLDACGTLGVYYTGGQSGARILSSSLNLIRNLIDTEWTANFHLKYNDGLPYMDYYPIPFTPYKDVFKLLPSQYFSFQEMAPVLHTGKFGNSPESFQECIQFIENKFCNILRNINDQFHGNIWIPLTAGVDSRVVFSAAYHCGFPFSAYTCIRDNSDDWDLIAPKRICKKLKIPYIQLDDRNPDDPERLDCYFEHCGGVVSVGTDCGQFVKGNDVPNAKHSIVLWGCVWEVHRHYFFDLIHSIDTDSFWEKTVKKSNIHRQSIEWWLQYIKDNKNELDFLDRLYYDQRIGSWLSSSFQAIDLFDSIRIAPINCGELIGTLRKMASLVFTEDERIDARFEEQLIMDYCPSISRIPYKRRKPVFPELARRAKKVLRKSGKRSGECVSKDKARI